VVIAVLQIGHRHSVGGRQSNAVGRNTVCAVIIGINSDLVEENCPNR
jgi:ribose/xylose/arabinose/galactoside ABC-type transport system permease subunit